MAPGLVYNTGWGSHAIVVGKMATESRSHAIEEFVLSLVENESQDVVNKTAEQFGITRQAVGRHLRKLIRSGVIKAEGKTKGRKYELAKLVDKSVSFAVVSGAQEDVVWRDNVAPLLANVAENVLDICRYGFTEMVNNVISHSESERFVIRVERDARRVLLTVMDDGVGIFLKVHQALGLNDPREAILELSKGKLTTDPEHHTGEGIFFTSQVFDEFRILSGDLYYSRVNANEDWLIEGEEAKQEEKRPGTMVTMMIHPDSKRTLRQVFDRFSDPATYAFTRTHVPLTLARYEGEELVSRSQARRILLRFERFKEVMLDFKNVKTIGQAFADEVFRVFQSEHPEISIIAVNTTPEIDQMISRARAAWAEKQLELPGI
jgi:anti-sigma regulatory factor (Ser/Thr protein kinase)